MIDNGLPYASPPVVASNLSYTQNIPQQRTSSPTIGNTASLADRAPNGRDFQQPGTARPQNTYQSPQPTGPISVDPAETSLTNEIHQLRNQLRSASGEQKKALHKSFTEAVGKLFDLRHAAQAKQVARLESELAEAKELHKKRGERKDEIVERRIAELLQSADDLAWNREIAGTPNAASTYAVPNGYSQPNWQNWRNFPIAPPSGSYPVTPSGTPYGTPYGTPNQPFYLEPQSSTPPQFIPLNSPDLGQTSLLQTTPNLASETPQPLPSIESSHSTSSANTNAEVASRDTFKTETIASNSATAFSISSKAAIEAAYAYEEALEAAIETKRLAAKGVFSARELSSAKRNAAKGKAIWTGMCRDLERRMEILKRDLDGKQVLIRSSTRERRTELGIEIAKLQSELHALIEEQDWADKFKKQSIDSLEKQLEQIEEKKEAKSEAAESVPNPNADLPAY
jgi:hypothetical protein